MPVGSVFQWRSQDLEIGLNKGARAEGFLPLCENSVVYDNLTVFILSN